MRLQKLARRNFGMLLQCRNGWMTLPYVPGAMTATIVLLGTSLASLFLPAALRRTALASLGAFPCSKCESQLPEDWYVEEADSSHLARQVAIYTVSANALFDSAAKLLRQTSLNI